MIDLISSNRFRWQLLYKYALVGLLVCVIPMIESEYSSTFACTVHRRGRCRASRSRLKIEEELRYSLRTLRKSIDWYKVNCEMGNVGPLDRKVNDYCYPPSLEVMVTGVKAPNKGVRIRYLRRIPVDPTTGKREWGLRSMQDDPNSNIWGGENVFDVYSKSDKKALDKSAYKDW